MPSGAPMRALINLCMPTCALLLLLICEPIAIANATLGGNQEEAISTFIEKEEKRLGGEENKNARSFWVESDTGRDEGRIAVLYTIEGVRGGTDWLQYLVVFVSSGQGILPENAVRVGGKGIRSIEGIESFRAGVVSLLTRNYNKSDALCCPSVPGVLKLAHFKGSWQESEVIINCP